MSYERRIDQWAELRVYGSDHGDDFDPDALTRRLGIEPSTVWRRGEVLRSGRVRAHTVWWWKSSDSVGPDSEVLVRQVLDRFEPVVAVLLQCRDEWDLELQLGLVVWMNGPLETAQDGSIYGDVPTPALAFSKETIARLARLNCGFDIDSYVSVPADE